MLTCKLLEHHEHTFVNMLPEPRILWCYGIEPATSPPTIPNVSIQWHEGMVEEEKLRYIRPDILVIDDMMREKANDTFTHNLFTKLSHHMNMTVIFITQNLYEKGQCNMKRNAHYIFLMRNPSDKSQISTLATQLFARRKSMLEHFFESYDDATKEKYGHLLIDVSPHSEERLKLKTNVIPRSSEEPNVIVYVPK